MNAITLIKLGGSLITDKRVESSYRVEVAHRIADEIAAAYHDARMPLIIGHGSGSFGHFAAHRHGTMQGVKTPDQWRGFAEVAAAAANLNALFTTTLRAAGLPIMRMQPSASMQCRNGAIVSMGLEPIKQALEHGLIPLVYGDVAFDDVKGGTIASTETIFTYLVQHLDAVRVILVGEVPGVYDSQQNVIPEITPSNVEEYRVFLGGSAGTDVTGGMLTKVSDMLALVTQHTGLRVQIIDGSQSGVLQSVLSDPYKTAHGTLIHAG